MSHEIKIEDLINISIRTQKLIEGAIPTGGLVASFYAKHRSSYDADHLLLKMTEEVDEIIHQLSSQKDWKPKFTKDVCILGKLDGIEIGLRQMFRKKPIKTQIIKTQNGNWIIPTIEEITSFKAILTSKRNNVRDYLDFAALAETIGNFDSVMQILLNLNEGYQEDWTLAVAKSLSDPYPVDLDSVDLSNYKNLDKKWQNWNSIVKICQHYGTVLTQSLMTRPK
jgi:hypothetical protein